MTAQDFERWLIAAEHHDILIYHIGYLPITAPPGLVAAVRQASEGGFVYLTQHKRCEGTYDYRATRSGEIYE